MVGGRALLPLGTAAPLMGREISLPSKSDALWARIAAANADVTKMATIAEGWGVRTERRKNPADDVSHSV